MFLKLMGSRANVSLVCLTEKGMGYGKIAINILYSFYGSTANTINCLNVEEA